MFQTRAEQDRQWQEQRGNDRPQEVTAMGDRLNECRRVGGIQIGRQPAE